MTNLSVGSRSETLADQGVSAGWLMALAVFFIILGIVGLIASYWMTAVAVFWFGILAAAGGIAQIIDAFRQREWKGVVWHALIGIVYLITGFFLVTMPLAAAFWLTLFLAISLVATGVLRIILAFQVRAQGSVWLAVLLSGLISIGLGVLIYRSIVPPDAATLQTPEGMAQWLQAWGWVIGAFVSIELLMEGFAQLSIARAARKAA
jgi:uncharacterized membrane protein HdeD (DUF308 family)